jgi:hypothetical protein
MMTTSLLEGMVVSARICEDEAGLHPSGEAKESELPWAEL